ncbi:DUF2577 domain-containing protein [Cohnella nanjingensis]|uniref:DUF2577 domain-containing protein n=1 Tax=Cohnella nanjingensis TaxID=1387779 RepID=A0A7X0VE26_9BACL|nr:DUF2577 domain-containing protein [Cohnella nanjingensis]MBB6670286.1 DUF2577 domain-containing protein [Cohnella nanjingensis]
MSVERLVGTIKQVAAGVITAGAPVEVAFGIVTSTTPLVITVDQRLPLKKEHLIFTASTAGGYMIGNQFLLLRMQGGQQYIVLDRVVTDE